MIPVTKPYLPELAEYMKYVNKIYQRNWLTNNGPLVNEFELRLKKFLNVNHLLYVTNGTIALQIALKSLELKGEIITTPFSYVATTSSIVWEGFTPVFVDIDRDTFNLNPSKIEEKITRNTVAILATHCFGNPCDIESIDTIAKRHNLKVIYDAAHCFGVEYNGMSIFSYGDISTTSFHATKLMHSVEGGGIFTNDPNLLKKMSYMRNFGHAGYEEFEGIGINGKNSEFHAAMGLANLVDINAILERRKVLFENYNVILGELKYKRQTISPNTLYNFSYYPVLFENEQEMLKIKRVLDDNEIFSRRYFYPCLNTLSYVDHSHTPIADHISKSILCLPLYHILTESEQELIARLMIRTQKYSV